MEQDAPEVRKAIAAFREHDGILRMADALRAGLLRRTLYAMRDAGRVEALTRGLYRLADAPPLSHPDLVTGCRQDPSQRRVPHLRPCVPRDDHADPACGLDCCPPQ